MVVPETNFILRSNAFCGGYGLEDLEGAKTLQDEATASRWKFIWGKHPGKKHKNRTQRAGGDLPARCPPRPPHPARTTLTTNFTRLLA